VVKAIISQFVPKIDVVEVCTDDLPEIAEEMGVVSIPTIKIYHKGELMDTIVGCVAKNVLGNAVNKVLDDLGLQDDSPSGDTDDDEEEDDDDDDDDDSVEDD
jgi:thioredoxin 1